MGVKVTLTEPAKEYVFVGAELAHERVPHANRAILRDMSGEDGHDLLDFLKQAMIVKKKGVPVSCLKQSTSGELYEVVQRVEI